MQIRDTDKERVLQIANQSFKMPVEIWAFGSRVKETASEGSDLDLVVVNKSKTIEIKAYIELFKENLKQSNIPIFVQVFEWDAMPSNYIAEIKKQHQVIFKN
ncbi:nucleotidyltransferase domain-containing protein [Flavobacterium sp.]|uniref:nucleotidyltransferase domain-containing protein n=1 Tax=Flavobacterium sp. TaxID=239 RepID=UPI00286A9FF1|nr:nucleotidyltransferase domain-containing protein [Flavobacterium sp.]